MISTSLSIVKNILWLFSSEFFYRCALFALAIASARILGPNDFGIFQFVLGFVSLFVLFSDFGLSDIILRDFAREKEAEKDFSAIFTLKIILTALTYGGMIGVSFFLLHDAHTRIIVLILGAFVLVNNFLSIFFTFFQARERMEYVALMRGAQALLLVTVGLGILFIQPSLLLLSYGYVVGAAIALFMALIFFHIFVKSLSFVFDIKIWKKYLRMALPIGGAAIVGNVCIYSAPVFLGLFGQKIMVGWYQAAYQLIGVSIIPSLLISIGFTPSISKAFARSKEQLQKIWFIFFKVTLFLAFPFVVGGFFLAPKIISFLYGNGYGLSVFILQILLMVGALNFVYDAFGTILIISHQQRKYFITQAIAAIVNIGGSMLLIPQFGMYGAALTAIATFAVLLFLGAFFAFRYTSVRILYKDFAKTVFFIAVSSAVMGTFLLLLSSFQAHVLVEVFAGIGVYSLMLFLFHKAKLLVLSYGE